VTCKTLIPGHTYTFRVQGFNENGAGPIGTSNPVTIPARRSTQVGPPSQPLRGPLGPLVSIARPAP